jgi:hypothetical protein
MTNYFLCQIIVLPKHDMLVVIGQVGRNQTQASWQLASQIRVLLKYELNEGVESMV